MTGITYPNSSTNSFTYNGLDTRVGKTDSSGTATYRRDGVDVTSPVLSDGSATYTPGISERRSGTTTYELNDRLGTGSRQTSTSATTTATRTYDAFGMLVSSTGTFKGPFGFAGAHGYQEDGDSGLKLLGHRYYDPSTGRFLTRDPVKDGRNWYGYCEGNPTRYVDPNGKFIWLLALVGIALLLEGCGPKGEDRSKIHEETGPADQKKSVERMKAMAYPVAIEDKVEYGGWIKGNGDATMTRGDQGTVSRGDKPEDAVAGWHIHPHREGESAGSGREFIEPTRPSDEDIRRMRENNLPEWIIDPDGNLHYYPVPQW